MGAKKDIIGLEEFIKALAHLIIFKLSQKILKKNHVSAAKKYLTGQRPCTCNSEKKDHHALANGRDNQ